MLGIKFGSYLILLCMLIRSTDVFFRFNILKIISPIQLIFLEHFIACIVLTLFWRKFKFIKLNFKEWFSLIFISWGASVGGILFFTLAFMYINPSVVILFQKLQPVVTISLAFLILGERKNYKFFLLASLALFSSYIVAFEFTFPSIQLLRKKEFIGAMFSLIAVFLWGSGTVFGKFLLKKMGSLEVTVYRYYLGLIFSAFLAFLIDKALFSNLANNVILGVSYMALFPGLLSLVLYYIGLKSTSASTASILELFFPISSVTIVWIFLDKPLSFIQIIAGFFLIISIFCVSLLKD